MNNDQINKDYVINSLVNQVASLSKVNAIKEAIIAGQQTQIKQLKVEIEKLENSTVNNKKPK